LKAILLKSIAHHPKDFPDTFDFICHNREVGVYLWRGRAETITHAFVQRKPFNDRAGRTGMGAFIVIMLVVGVVCFWFIRVQRKLEWVDRHDLIYVDGAERRYPNLPMGSYGIPVRARDADGYKRVQVIFPRLTEDGDMEYIYSWHDLGSIELATSRESDAPALFSSFSNVAPVIQEHLQIEAEIDRLLEERHKVHDLARILSTSEFYANQADIYDRALEQIENLLDKARELEHIYVRIIRETLIGLQVSRYEPDDIPGDMVSFDAQYKHLKAEYLRMKDTATAYDELMYQQSSLQSSSKPSPRKN
jgi:hypothetical protein